MQFIKITVILFFGCILALSSCSDEDNSEIVTMKVNHFKQSGEGLFLSQFLLVQEGDGVDGATWNRFYDNIQGFNYELGYEYLLKVAKENIETPPADGISIRYTLIKVLSKNKAPSGVSFDILLSRLYDDGNVDLYLNKTDNSTLQLLDGTKIDCGSLCDALSEKLVAKEGFTGVFKHLYANELSLTELKY